MIEYRVRSTSLLNLVNDVNTQRLIPDAYFQRNLVWREVHKKEFIRTILLGLPFPQIFVSKGKVNVDTMSTVSCIVDGQQRTDAIVGYLNNSFDVDGKRYVDLTESQKSDFLKYEVAVIELDLENDDPKVQDIFQRINRTSTSLSSIEKLASQYSTSEFMLVAKLLSDQISLAKSEDEDFRDDPNVPDEFYVWAQEQTVKNFSKLLNDKGIFSAHEIARKTNLMHVLNIMSAVIGGLSNRNDKAIEHLDDFAYQFKEREQVVKKLDRAADFILKLGLRAKSYWFNKANFFTLIVCIVATQDADITLDPAKLKQKLHEFETNIPDEYKLAASEGVNSTKARDLRSRYVLDLISSAKALA